MGGAVLADIILFEFLCGDRDTESLSSLFFAALVVFVTCITHRFVGEGARSLTTYFFFGRLVVLLQAAYSISFQPVAGKMKSVLSLTPMMQEVHTLLLLMNHNLVEAVCAVSKPEYLYYNFVSALLCLIFSQPVQNVVLRFLQYLLSLMPSMNWTVYIERFVQPIVPTRYPQWRELARKRFGCRRQAEFIVFLIQRTLLMQWYLMTNRFFLSATVTYHTQQAISHLTGVMLMYPQIFFEIWSPVNLVRDIVHLALHARTGAVWAGLTALIPCIAMAVLTSYYMYTNIAVLDSLLFFGYNAMPGMNFIMSAAQFGALSNSLPA